MNDSRLLSSTGPSTATPPIGLGRSSTIDLDLLLARRFQQIAQRRHVGVEAAADVLDVVDQRVDAFELLGGRPAPLAVQAEDRQAGLLVLAVATFSSSLPRMPCSGLKSATELHVLRLINRSMVVRPSAVDAGVVGYQPDLAGPSAVENLATSTSIPVSTGWHVRESPANRSREGRETAAPPRRRRPAWRPDRAARVTLPFPRDARGCSGKSPPSGWWDRSRSMFP